MRRLLDVIRDGHNTLLISVLMLLCLAGLLYLYPREGNFRFTYFEGQIWGYDDLYSPADMDVHLMPTELEAQQEAIRAEAIPVYRRKTEVEQRQLAMARDIATEVVSYMNPVDFSAWTGRSMKQDSAIEYAVALIESSLRDIYQVGVIDIDPQHEMFSDMHMIRVIEGAYAADVRLGDLLTLTTAIERFGSDKRSGPEYIHEALENTIGYNLTYDSDATLKLVETRINAIPLKKSELKEGQLVIRKGERIGSKEYRELEAIKANFEANDGMRRSWWVILLGQALLIGLGLLSITVIVYMVRPEIFDQPTRVTFLLLLLLLMALMLKGTMAAETLSVYLAPLCIVPIVLRAFYDSRLALLVHVINVCLLGFIVPASFEFVILHIFAGVLLLYGMKSVARRSAFFMASFILLIAYSLSFFALRVIQEGNFDGISFLDFAWLGGNALLTMMAFPLIFLFERSFGFLSEIRLLEISDSSNALLRELNEKAPGTFQHSLQVANLAEEAIHEIGGNELLVRVGALYHDIGKTSMSAFFTENQHGVNPHDKLEPEESARVIVSHVISGIEMARKARLPEEIIDFIRTHHGTSRVEYFYHQATQAGTEVDERLFRYPGPLPFTRETAVVMMADAVEASSRSLAEYSEASLSALIDRIIDAQQAMGQFDNSPLTFRDIGLIKSVFLRKLLNIYHSRIAYPEKKI